MNEPSNAPKKRKLGIPTGNAGEYFVMGELLKRGFDAQLADRNTKGYDVLVGRPEDEALRKVEVKAARRPPWYVRKASFDDYPDQVTIYVLLGKEDGQNPVRYFIARNRDLKKLVTPVHGWPVTALMELKALKNYEGCWQTLLAPE